MRFIHLFFNAILLIAAQLVPTCLYGMHTFADNSVLAEGKWVKIALDGKEDGVYQITFDQLRKMGFSDPCQVGVYGFGGHVLSENLEEIVHDDLPEVSIYQDIKNNRILFYANGLIRWDYSPAIGYYHRQNTYETKAYYFLHQKNDFPQTLSNPALLYSNDSTSVTDLAHELHEEELVNIGQTGREKYGESFLNNKSQTFHFGTFCSGEISIRINAIAKAKDITKFLVKVNGQDEGELSINATSGSYTFANEGWFEKKLILAEESEIEVSLSYQSENAKAEIARLNYIEVSGQKTKAVPDFEQEKLPGIKIIGEIENQNLHALQHTDLVIVSAPAYISEANRLADYRRSNDHLSVIVLTPEQIYNEFSSGGQDVTAIRLLMKKLQPRYLLLFGDGHYDNQKINRQFQLPSYETDYSLAETSSCVCDDYFGFIDAGEGGNTDNHLRYQISEETLDLGVGRLPASNVQEAKAMVKKIIAYSENRYQGDWKSRLCFLSDDDKQGDSYNAHIRHNEQLIARLENAGRKEYSYQKIYLPAYKQTSSAAGTDYPDAKKEFLESLKQGVLLVNYAGHGNTTTITNENLMTSAVASQLSMRYLPVWVTASCDVGRWDNDESSLGEQLILNANGGAIAMLTTVRVVYAQQNLILNQAIIDNLFNRFDDGTRYRLGDVLMAAKRTLGKDYNKLNFCLLGDPSLTMTYPEQKISVTEINGKAVSSESEVLTFKALETITLKGAVYKTGSTTEIDSTFNGIVFTTLYDALDTIVADKGYLQDEADAYIFTNRTRKAFSGRGEIRYGGFEFTFMVPQDLSYSNKTGLATLYACSDHWAEAQGYFDRYTLSGNSESVKTDTVGPQIRHLFLNDMLFSDGAVVNSTPYFYAEIADENGFNTTGNGIGHDMILTIKSKSNQFMSPRQYILNNYFATHTGKFNEGNVQFSIPALENGEYEASFTVWDVYNNVTRKLFSFTVANGKAPEAVAVQAYPSPAIRGEKLTFRVLHNRPESETEMHLQVFSSSGNLIYETQTSIKSTPKYYALDMKRPTIANQSILADETPNFMGASTIEWSTPNLDPGFYVYRIVLTSNGSHRISESKILIITE